MQDFIRKTFGGLSAPCYLRHLFFGSLFFAAVVWLMVQSKGPVRVDVIFFTAVCTLLYPYSRFVYERVIGFLMGENVFFVNAVFMLFVKLWTMTICWAFSIFIAPVGLVYLYFYHRNASV